MNPLLPPILLHRGLFSRLLLPNPGLALQVQYQGMPGQSVVNVGFK